MRNENLFEQSWKKSQEQLMEIKNADSLANYLSAKEVDWHGALVDAKKEGLTIACMDEGTPYGLFRVAGLGILFGTEYMKRVIGKLKADGWNFNGIYWHKDCGAAKEFVRRENLPADQFDQEAKKFAETVSNISEIKFLGEIEDTGKSLTRPAEFHDSVCAYIDFSGRFNPALVSELPKGFVISAAYHLDTVSETDLRSPTLEDTWLAINIALGNHGFGEKFSSENPFLIVLIYEKNNLSDFLIFRDKIKKKIKEGNLRDRVILDKGLKI